MHGTIKGRHLFTWQRVVVIPARVKVLLDAGADIHARAEDGRTPLHLAEQYGGERYDDPGAIPVLLAAGANPDARDEKHNTPLHMAALDGKLWSLPCCVTAGLM